MTSVYTTIADVRDEISKLTVVQIPDTRITRAIDEASVEFELDTGRFNMPIGDRDFKVAQQAVRFLAAADILITISGMLAARQVLMDDANRLMNKLRTTSTDTGVNFTETTKPETWPSNSEDGLIVLARYPGLRRISTAELWYQQYALGGMGFY